MAATGGMKARGHYIRKRLRLAAPARRLAAFALLFLAAGILVLRLGAIEFEALKGVLVVAFALAALSFLIAGLGLVRAWSRGYEGGGVAVGALALSILTLAPFAFAGVLAYDNPQVSAAVSDGMEATDIAAEPATAAGGAETGLVSGRRFQATAAQVFGVSRLVLDDLGWNVAGVAANAPVEEEDGDLGTSGTIGIPVPTPRESIDQDAGEDPMDQPDSSDYAIEAVATGPILALPSDVSIRIVEDGPETFVDLRSVSRDVAWDLGQNRRFIEDFLTRLDTAMAGALTVVPPAAAEN
ncbi:MULTISPECIES: DUF1499 domain-containing protein [unclassified Aureimonas]|uniref:DUF1499 domain-containing protein n=1 Tax=unclassified Aureimonas TaxID=2615206 RepID=UPI0006F2DB2A|nr:MULTISPECIES: DUF1499 domain-containing protein [unclassified Aureimonas]KQT61281.1 hypothetical protein ASG54_24410 [Aureimonas sp. Leaf460]KQT68730.1 hypothetical protein ASG62_19170 [Aureimonas sp. Leaf427]